MFTWDPEITLTILASHWSTATQHRPLIGRAETGHALLVITLLCVVIPAYQGRAWDSGCHETIGPLVWAGTGTEERFWLVVIQQAAAFYYIISFLFCKYFKLQVISSNVKNLQSIRIIKLFTVLCRLSRFPAGLLRGQLWAASLHPSSLFLSPHPGQWRPAPAWVSQVQDYGYPPLLCLYW